MVEKEDYILLHYGIKKPKEETTKCEISRIVIHNSIKSSLYYAFASLPFTNANIKSGKKEVGLDITKRIENILKGRLAEEIIIFYLGEKTDFRKELKISQYLSPHPIKTPYWENDECDAVRIKNGEILADVDIKTINFKLDCLPTKNNLQKMELVRSKRSPSKDKIKRPFGILLEEPWRHFNKLLYQKKKKKEADFSLNRPFEVLFGICSNFSLKQESFNELTELYLEYYEHWKSKKEKNLKRGRIPFPDKIDITKLSPKLEDLIQTPKTFPESLYWLIDNWKKIEEVIDLSSSKIIEKFDDYWIWVLGFANQSSASHFKNVYQNDAIIFNRKKIWSSAGRAPNERKFSDFKKGKRKSNPTISEGHPDFYLNNHVIDIKCKNIFSVKEYLK